MLTYYHYKKVPLDDALSEKIINRYIELLDPERFFFLQSDIDQFMANRDKIDDAIFSDDLSIPFAIFNVYEQRYVERLTYARELLKNWFRFQSERRVHAHPRQGALAENRRRRARTYGASA